MTCRSPLPTRTLSVLTLITGIGSAIIAASAVAFSQICSHRQAKELRPVEKQAFNQAAG
jgi:hypothetical protein